MKTTRRWHCALSLQTGSVIALPADVVQHLITVLRLKAGDIIHPFNAADGEWQAVLQQSSKRDWQAMVQSQMRPALEVMPTLTLAFGLLKRDAMDWLVEKASELGVTHLQPLITDHTPAERVNIDRLQKIATEAAEQCERLDVPQVLPTVKLRDWLGARDATPLLVALERAEAKPLLEVTQTLLSSSRLSAGIQNDLGILDPQRVALRMTEPLTILIGPAGGFSANEAVWLPTLPNVHCCDLGPRLLRAETAALMCLSVVNALMNTNAKHCQWNSQS